MDVGRKQSHNALQASRMMTLWRMWQSFKTEYSAAGICPKPQSLTKKVTKDICISVTKSDFAEKLVELIRSYCIENANRAKRNDIIEFLKHVTSNRSVPFLQLFMKHFIPRQSSERQRQMGKKEIMEAPTQDSFHVTWPQNKLCIFSFSSFYGFSLRFCVSLSSSERRYDHWESFSSTAWGS